METNLIKLVVFVPETHADLVREAMGDVGAGKVGKYSHCTYSSKGIGRFKPEQGAEPSIGEVGKLEMVEEERIEVLCERQNLQNLIGAIKKVHPYEEIVMDIYPVETL